MDKIFLARQIVPVAIGSLLGVSFGTMMGWTSATFPLLTDSITSPITISWDESATIAAFLMEGTIAGTAISTVTLLGSKLGVLLSGVCQIVGWTVMYFAEDMLTIAVSRILIGFGYGFGVGQLRIYAKESCEPKIFQTFMKYLPLSVNLGVIFTFAIGGLVPFRTISLVCVGVPIVNVILFAIIPKNIYETQLISAVTTIYDQNKPNLGVTKVVADTSCQVGFIQAFKTKEIRNGLILLFFIIFIPQYTGFAANINYSQVVHIAALNPNPHLCSIIYSIAFLFSTIIAIKYANRFRRKPMLVCSCLICGALLCLVCLNFYFLIDLLKVSSAFAWSPLILLCLFNFVHVIGINTIPTLLINDRFPTNARIVATKFYVMYFSLSAIFTTKIFQVLFTSFKMYMPYVFLSSVSFTCALLALIFFRESKPKKIDAKIEEGFYNQVDLSDEIRNTLDKL